jgi:hypothetical protein
MHSRVHTGLNRPLTPAAYRGGGLRAVKFSVKTNTGLEAFQLVFEHELCHVIEFVFFNTSNCSKKRFKVLSNNIFGHTESYHKLPTNRQIAQQKYGFKIGDKVTFIFKGKTIQGIIFNINKRATVMVEDSNGHYAYHTMLFIA